MEASSLQITWFVLVTVLLTGYAILDGFDLGVGVLTLFTKDDTHRRLQINAVGPVWDGNEVWLLTGGGALFAAFPPVYATVFSSFYMALMLLLLVLITRAVSMEFRGKVESDKWRVLWDKAFGISSFLIALLLGVALANLVRGLPILVKSNQIISDVTFLGLLNPYSLVGGLLSVVLFTFHGAIFLGLKTEGELQKQMKTAAKVLFIPSLVLALAYVAWTFGLHESQSMRPLAILGIVLSVAGIIVASVFYQKNLWGRSFLSSSLGVAGLMIFVAAVLFPNLTFSLNGIGNHLNIVDHSSTPKTLKVMLTIALLGVPLVLVYTVFIYRIFKGKVTLDEHSY